MVSKLLVGWALMGLCVVVHAAGVTSAVRWLRQLRTPSTQFRQWTWRFVWLGGWIILLHLVEVTVWGLFYLWKDAMPDLASALYFSAVTYTTTGYGDLVLPQEWRLLGAIEALTGILMCGWSTGFFFAVVSRMFEATPVDR
jgi:ion channel